METNSPSSQSADSAFPAVANPSLPAVAPPEAAVDEPAVAPVRRGQPVNVAFLPLALAVFVIIAFVLAAWTFLAAA